MSKIGDKIPPQLKRVCGVLLLGDCSEILLHSVTSPSLPVMGNTLLQAAPGIWDKTKTTNKDFVYVHIY